MVKRHSFVLCLLHVLECLNNAEYQMFQETKCGQWFVTTARMQLEYEALHCRSHMWDGLIIVPHLNSWRPWYLCQNTVSRESPTTAEGHGCLTPGVSTGLSLSVIRYGSMLKDQSMLDLRDWFCQVLNNSQNVSFLFLFLLNYDELWNIWNQSISHTFEENFTFWSVKASWQ